MPLANKKYGVNNNEKGKQPFAQETASIKFSHPGVKDHLGDLVIPINPDQITWSYGLNTANYQTYGGEVVQILSMFVGDMTIAGTVRSYSQMESIYRWFAFYMQQATQGRNAPSYDMRPVEFEYLTRGWKFKIMPTAAPGFKYGRDVVAPSWRLSAAVVDFSDNFKNVVMDDANLSSVAAEGDFEPFGTVTAGIGYDDQNPWSQPYDKNNKMWDEKKKKYVSSYQDMLQAYMDNKDSNVSEMTADMSKPVFLKG